MGRVKIQIGLAKHEYIYHPVEKDMWFAANGGGDVYSVWMCERADDKDASDRKLILVQFADKVVAYDCSWQMTSDSVVVFSDPREIYCRTAALGDVRAVFFNGRHAWFIKDLDGWRPAGWFSTKRITETDDEPMGGEDWLMVYNRGEVVWQGAEGDAWVHVRKAGTGRSCDR